MDINTIVAALPEQLVPLRDANGVIHDESTVALRCERRHMHRYYLADVVGRGARLRCETCSAGNKAAVLLRETAEAALGVPFVWRAEPPRQGANVPQAEGAGAVAAEFENPTLGIRLVSLRGGEDGFEQLTIRAAPTKSAKKIRDLLYQALHGADLPPEVAARVAALGPKVPQERQRRPPFRRDPLPYTEALAAASPHNRRTPTLARLQLNIVSDDSLCLENC